MKNILKSLALVLLFSCSEKQKNNPTKNQSKSEIVNSNEVTKPKNLIKSSQEEIDFEKFKKSIKVCVINPIKILDLDNEIKQKSIFRIANHSVEVFKKDSLNIDWIKINAKKIMLNDLETINLRTSGKKEKLFCNNVNKIKLYQIDGIEIIFIELDSNPCTGLGCSVSDYIIYDVKNEKINLFGSFRSINFDLYEFKKIGKISYIATDFHGDFHGPSSFTSRIYSLDSKGKFQIEKNSKGQDYYYQVKSPNTKAKGFEYKYNWL